MIVHESHNPLIVRSASLTNDCFSQYALDGQILGAGRGAERGSRARKYPLIFSTQPPRKNHAVPI